MRPLKRTALLGMLLGVWIITAPQAAKGAGSHSQWAV
jgi:hypothetical protein